MCISYRRRLPNDSNFDRVPEDPKQDRSDSESQFHLVSNADPPTHPLDAKATGTSTGWPTVSANWMSARSLPQSTRSTRRDTNIRNRTHGFGLD